MNILYIDWPCFGSVDVLFTLEHEMQHDVTKFFHKDYQERQSSAFQSAFHEVVENHNFDCCFSFNYYPIISECCKQHNLKYIAFVYDSPYAYLFSYTVINPNNYIFIFDNSLYQRLAKENIPTVYYMPLPANASVIDTLLTKCYDKERLSADVSFVGALYNEQHNLFEKLEGMNDYCTGYINALVQAQLKVSGYNFLEECILAPHILTELQRIYPIDKSAYSAEPPAYSYAHYFINRKITSLERCQLLSSIAAHFPLKIFTYSKNASIPFAQLMGTADYYSEMPYIFHNSKINLNITLRSIESGIPLRAMDIMANEGFLLTNYQGDFLLENFIPDEDFVYFEDEKDLLKKIDYYLAHDEKRSSIAHNGRNKIKEYFSYRICFEKIFHIVFS